MYRGNKTYPFCGSKATLCEVIDILDAYDMQDIETLIRQRAFGRPLLMRLENYLLTRAMRHLIYTKSLSNNG